MTSRYDIHRMADDYQNGFDRERAVEISKSLLEDVIEGRVDPVALLADIEEAAMIQWDAPRGQPGLVLQALRTSDRDFMTAAARHAPTSSTGMALTMRPNTLRAETLHRVGEYRKALDTSYGGLHWLIKHARGNSDEELAKILAIEIPTPLAEHAVADLAIHVAVIRRSGHVSAEGKRRLMDQCRRFAEAYVLRSGRTPVMYPRTHAFATQMFLAFKELAEPGDRALIAALHDLMNRARPDTARSRATAALAELEWFDYIGDQTARTEAGYKAAVDLIDFELLRHVAVVGRLGFIRRAVSAA